MYVPAKNRDRPSCKANINVEKKKETQPLPENGMPKNFDNTIGEFQMDANLGKNNLEVGDTRI